MTQHNFPRTYSAQKKKIWGFFLRKLLPLSRTFQTRFAMAKHVRFEEIYSSRPRTQWLLSVSLLAAVSLFVVGLCIGVFGIRSGDTFNCGGSYTSFLPFTATESPSVSASTFAPEDVVRDKLFAEFKAENIRNTCCECNPS